MLISGASFAGLASAFWMIRLGFRVTLVEIAKDLRKGGTPVDIREGVIDVVRRMGLLERIAAASLPARAMQFLDASGSPLATLTSRGEDAFDGYEIERDDLLDMLYSEVEGKVEFLFAESIAALEQSTDQVAVTFASGEKRAFSLVLGCDGTHSAVRRLCFGPEAPFSLFLQNYFSLTIVDKLLIPENTSQLFNVPGKTVMLNAYNNKTDIGFCFASEQVISYDRRDREDQRRMIGHSFQGEGWRVAELLEEMNRSDNFYFDQLCQIRMGFWSSGRVTLVGDAAYCPSPAAGMGGSMALLGAAALAEAWERFPGDHRKAFEEYDRSFRPTVESIQEEAVNTGLELFMPKTQEALDRRNRQLCGH